MNYFVVQIWEDEKTDSSQGGKDFFYLRQLRVMALNVFSLVLFHICFAVLLIASEGANSYIADWKKV